jgi:hypothetical protein
MTHWWNTQFDFTSLTATDSAGRPCSSLTGGVGITPRGPVSVLHMTLPVDGVSVLLSALLLRQSHVVFECCISICERFRGSLKLGDQYPGFHRFKGYIRVYPEVSGLAAWSENCKWYNSLPLGAVVSQFLWSV